MAEFAFEDMPPIGPDRTASCLATTDGVRTVEGPGGRTLLEVAPEALRRLTDEAMHNIAHYLRRAHLAQLRRILEDAYTRLNLRYSRMAPVATWEEQNTGSDLPAQIELHADTRPGHETTYRPLFLAKGGGSANNSFPYQESKAVVDEERRLAFLDEKLCHLGTTACPPYHPFEPTTAGRMDSCAEQFQAGGGSMVMLAKGNRSRQVTDAGAAHGGFHLGSIGGPAARLVQDCIPRVEALEYPELDREAVWRIEVEDFPAFVVDALGRDVLASRTTPLAAAIPVGVGA